MTGGTFTFIRLASCTVCMRETGRAAPRSARGCAVGAFGFSAALKGCGRPTRGAGLGAEGPALEVAPAREPAAVAGRGAGAVDLAGTGGATLVAGGGAALAAATGGAWPYPGLMIIFCGLPFGNVSLLGALSSLFGSLSFWPVGRRLFGGGGGGISSPESGSCMLGPVLVRVAPGRG